jgi:hypothetical protein
MQSGSTVCHTRRKETLADVGDHLNTQCRQLLVTHLRGLKKSAKMLRMSDEVHVRCGRDLSAIHPFPGAVECPLHEAAVTSGSYSLP